MHSKNIAHLMLILVPLLWLHVNAQDITQLLEDNPEIDSASNEDDMEFNEIRNRLQDGGADPEELAAEFENYLTRRQTLRDSISELLQQARQQNNTPLVNSLIDALGNDNAGKEAAIQDAIEQLTNSVSAPTTTSNNQRPNSPRPNNRRPGTVLDPSINSTYDLAQFLRQFFERGGSLLSPSINQVFAPYSPVPQQVNDPNNKSVQGLLKRILEKIEYFTNDSDDGDDYFELLNWFKLLTD